MGLYRLIYHSVESDTFEDGDIDKILKMAKKRNVANNITGLLLHIDHGFIQVLEGEEQAVLQLFNNIEKDSRNTNVIRMLEGNVNTRLFPDWNLGFRVADESDMEELKRINNNPNFNLLEILKTDNELTLELMKCFYEYGYMNYSEFWTNKY